MIKTRIIPCLQLIDESLVKTIKFSNPKYIGDPINTVRIFNELEVDELCFIDIRASKKGISPNFKILKEIANECFMPLSYGGGLIDLNTIKKIFNIGFEKVIINTAAHENPSFISEVANHFGNQSIIASIDVKKNFFNKYRVYTCDGTKKTKLNPIEWAKELQSLGAGELLVTSIDRDGTWTGYDIDLLKKITSSVNIPVIANGGAGDINHIISAKNEGNASAIALGSMVVYQGKDLGVLINFPSKEKLNKLDI